MSHVKFLINAHEIPGGKTVLGRWRNAKEAQAELERIFNLMLRAFPGAHVNVTTHAGDTVLSVSSDLAREKAEKLCAEYLRPQSRSPSSSDAPRRSTATVAETGRTAE